VANGKDPRTTGEHIIALYGHISGLKKQQDHMHKGLDDVRQKVNWFFVELVLCSISWWHGCNYFDIGKFIS
jgi:hypothetical protein